MIDHHTALIYTMVLVSAADRDMTDAELRKMGEVISGLPVFHDYSQDLLPATASSCIEFLEDENGLDQAIAAIKAGLPKKLRETAYALACDVAAADEHISPEEIRLLEILRDRLEIDRLVAAAIERAARARFTKLTLEDR
ncbi:MAG: tellurite resistance TerB family protein [Rhodospirillales bacterium]|nr:tellurite resistance TerB family protein [Rhodospirillales bacterium]